METNPNYPYWLEEFNKEFKDYQVYYREDGWPKNVDDSADSYRVFMILCNNRPNQSRMETLTELKQATEENPIRINDEIFWTEKD